MSSQSSASLGEVSRKPVAANEPEVVSQHIVEFVSDSGEGAQTAGQMFGTVSARMGNGVWTVEIIPAEIEPPHRSRAGASGNRIRIASHPVTNMGEAADVVVAFNEQVPYSRIDVGALREGHDHLSRERLERVPRGGRAQGLRRRRWRISASAATSSSRRRWRASAGRSRRTRAAARTCGAWACCARSTAAIWTSSSRNSRRSSGARARRSSRSIANWFRPATTGPWTTFPYRYQVPPGPTTEKMVVMNGNQAAALGIMAAGIEVVAMYPITPATSVSHYLAASFHKVGGFLHQAEDEISAIGFALGASYAGKTAATVTSGPGLALKTEFLGLAVMAELPLVLIVVQRGSPSTGLPTRVEQGDLLAAVHGEPGDAPKIVMAASTIEECFQFVVTARKLAEAFRGPVIVLTDANLATGQTLFPLPEAHEDWLTPPIDQSDWEDGVRPYDWDPTTGLSQRPVPGQRGGEYVLTGLAHDESSHVAYESAINQRAMRMRSHKLITLQKSLRPPKVYGDPEGDLLVVGWGSTRGAIEEAIDRLREEGLKVSSVTLRFLSPLEPGLKEIFGKFKEVMTVELNYSDDHDDPVVPAEHRRRSQLARLLRQVTLIDIDCWSRVPGVPLSPSQVKTAIHDKLARMR